MQNSIINSIFSSTASTISISDFLICIACSLVIGVILAFAYVYRTRCTKGFVSTLALLPAVVCIVIMMVNGNVGTGVAVAGAFSLVRFRSAPGTAKEIGIIFLAMAAGMITGMGYIFYAFLFTFILCAAMIFYSHFDFGAQKRSSLYRTLHITIPEDLDYTGVFDELLSRYTSSYELTAVKTTNMGSLFRLTYDITLRSEGIEKALIDDLRIRNGNLEISISRQDATIVGL